MPVSVDTKPIVKPKCLCKAAKLIDHVQADHERTKLNDDLILPDILHQVGRTPMIKINKIGREAGLKCDLCESAFRLIYCNLFISG